MSYIGSTGMQTFLRFASTTDFDADLAMGSYGLITWANTNLLACDGNRLWASTNRGGAWTQQNLPAGITAANGLRMGLARSRQFPLGVLLITGAGQPGYSGTPDFRQAGVRYFPITGFTGGQVQYGSPRTAASAVGVSNLVHLDWPGRGVGGADRLVGATQQGNWRAVSGQVGIPIVLRWIIQGAGLADVDGPWWLGAAAQLPATPRDIYPQLRGGGFAVDIEHDGRNNGGTNPIERQFRLWFCGATPSEAATAVNTGGLTVGRVNPHVTPAEVVTSVWTGAALPTDGVWNGRAFVVARFVNGVVVLREYTTPSAYVQLPPSPVYPQTAAPMAVRVYLTPRGYGVFCLQPGLVNTTTNRRPLLYNIEYNRSTVLNERGQFFSEWETGWTELGALEPQWGTSGTSLLPLPAVNADRFPDWGAHCTVLDNLNGVYHYKRLTRGKPSVRWQPTAAVLEGTAQPHRNTLTLTWVYTDEVQSPQSLWELERVSSRIRGLGTSAERVVDSLQYWNAASSVWQDSNVRNTGPAVSAALPGASADNASDGWAGNFIRNRFPPVRFRLRVFNTAGSDPATQPAQESDWLGPLTVNPSLTLAAPTITSPAAAATLTTRPDLVFTFPAAAPFDSRLITDNRVLFAAVYTARVRTTPVGSTSQVFYEAVDVPVEFQSAAPWQVTVPLPFLPNGTYQAEVSWRMFGYPYNQSPQTVNAFTVNLTAPDAPVLTFQPLAVDGTPGTAFTSGLTQAAGVRVIMTGDGGTGQMIASARVERREQTRGDHRLVNVDPVRVGAVEAYASPDRVDDYTVAHGVEYQYRTVVTGTSGSVTVGGWTPA